MPSSEIYYLTHRWAARMLEILQQGDVYEYTFTMPEEGLELQWNTKLPCLHVAYNGSILCTSGRMHWQNFPDIEVQFTVTEQTNQDGLRMIWLQVCSIETGSALTRLQLMVKDQDEKGRMVIHPHCEYSEAILSGKGAMKKAIYAIIYYIMSNVMQVQYDKNAVCN